MLKKTGLDWPPIIFAFVLIAVTGVLFFIKPLCSPDHILNFSDVIHVWYFLKSFTVNSLYSFGELPLWNPLIYSGVPFVGNPQSALFYPLNWLFYVIPVHYCITILFTIHLIFAGCGMFLYSKLRKLGFSASLFASIIFVLNFKVMGHMFAGHLNIICSFAYIPWLFIAIEFFVTKRNFQTMIWLAICTSFIFLCSHPQIFYYHFVIGSVYLLSLTFAKDNKSVVGVFIGYLICGFFVFIFTAISLLPILELMREFSRSGGTDFDFAATMSLQWKHLVTLIYPHFYLIPEVGSNIKNGFFWETAIYVGIIPFFLSFLSYRDKQRHHWRFFLFLFFLTLLFSLGSNGLFFKLCYNIIPGVKFFRCPARIYLFTGFAISILSAFAFQNIIDNRYDSKISVLTRILTIVAIIFIIANEIMFYVFKTAIPGAGKPIIFLLALCAVLYAWRKGHINKPVFISSILAITLFDLASIAIPLIKTKPLTKIMPQSSIYNNLVNDHTTYRVFDTVGALPQYLGEICDIQQIGGDEPVMLNGYLDYINSIPKKNKNISEKTPSIFPLFNLRDDKINFSLLNFLNVKYLFTTFEMKNSFMIEEEVTLLSELDTENYYGNYEYIKKVPSLLKAKTYLYRNIEVLPRGFLVEIKDNESADFVWDDIIKNPAQQIIPAHIEVYEPNKIIFVTESDKPAYLLTSEIYYPGWTAEIDGKETDVIAVKNLFRGLRLDSGKHEIEFIYQPKSYVLGKKITLLGLGLFLVLLLVRKFSLKNTKK